MENQMENLLKEKFLPKEIEWRVQSSSCYNNKPQVIIVPYLKSKAIKDRLDKIFGWENWETRFIPIEKGFICELTIEYNGKKIIKSDGAQFTNIESIKGGMSDSFKRAAKMLGIGRYLDACGSVFAACSMTKGGIYTEYTKTKDGKYIYWAKPQPQPQPQKQQQQQPQPQIQKQQSQQQPQQQPQNNPQQQQSQKQGQGPNDTITEPQRKRLYAIYKKYNWSENDIKDYIKVNFDLDSKKDLVKSQYDQLINHIENATQPQPQPQNNPQQQQQPQPQPPLDDDFLPMPVSDNYYAKAAK